jgi:hypothetical protein
MQTQTIAAAKAVLQTLFISPIPFVRDGPMAVDVGETLLAQGSFGCFPNA